MDVGIGLAVAILLSSSAQVQALRSGMLDDVIFKQQCGKVAQDCEQIRSLTSSGRKFWVKSGDGIVARHPVRWMLCEDDESALCLTFHASDNKFIDESLAESRMKFAVLVVRGVVVAAINVRGPSRGSMRISQLDGTNSPSDLVAFFSQRPNE